MSKCVVFFKALESILNPKQPHKNLLAVGARKMYLISR